MEILNAIGNFILENRFAFDALVFIITLLVLKIALRLFPTLEEATVREMVVKFLDWLLKYVPDNRKIKQPDGTVTVVNVAKKTPAPTPKPDIEVK